MRKRKTKTNAISHRNPSVLTTNDATVLQEVENSKNPLELKRKQLQEKINRDKEKASLPFVAANENFAPNKAYLNTLEGIERAADDLFLKSNTIDLKLSDVEQKKNLKKIEKDFQELQLFHEKFTQQTKIIRENMIIIEDYHPSGASKPDQNTLDASNKVKKALNALSDLIQTSKGDAWNRFVICLSFFVFLACITCGACIGFLLGNGGGALFGAMVGAAIGAIIGIGLYLYLSEYRDNTDPENRKNAFCGESKDYLAKNYKGQGFFQCYDPPPPSPHISSNGIGVMYPMGAYHLPNFGMSSYPTDFNHMDIHVWRPVNQ